jgi:hypothetical protein
VHQRRSLLVLHLRTDRVENAPAQPARHGTGQVDGAEHKKICSFFKQGKCTKGEACSFLHPRTDRVEPAPEQPAGHGTGDMRDSIAGKKICRHFLSGTCKYGRNCQNLHVRNEDPPNPIAPPSDAKLICIECSTEFIYKAVAQKRYVDFMEFKTSDSVCLIETVQILLKDFHSKQHNFFFDSLIIR